MQNDMTALDARLAITNSRLDQAQSSNQLSPSIMTKLRPSEFTMLVLAVMPSPILSPVAMTKQLRSRSPKNLRLPSRQLLSVLAKPPIRDRTVSSAVHAVRVVILPKIHCWLLLKKSKIS